MRSSLSILLCFFIICIPLAFGTDMQWMQLPDLAPTGMDVCAVKPLILADDWLCTQTTKVTEIRIWGSWINDNIPDPGNVRFTLSIHADIPAGPGTPSRPGETLWLKTFNPRSFLCNVYQQNISEGWYNPSQEFYMFPGDTICFEYTFNIPEIEAFCQQGTAAAPKVYWLDVQAEPVNMPGSQFGWKTSETHWNDDACWGEGEEPYDGLWNEMRYPQQHQYYGQSIDLAFALFGEIPCESQLGACCYGINPQQCIVTDQLTCEQQFVGSWQGPATDCTDADGNGVADECEQSGLPEFGDAPEGVLAYPATGTNGLFPTCTNVGSASWIQHNSSSAWLGAQFDLESDGNAGLCPGFNPYNSDECVQDGDAGLVIATAYTIDSANNVVACAGASSTALGQTCQTAVWGVDIDVEIHNHIPGQAVAFVNMLVDWDQNGQWGGAPLCAAAGNVPEHALINFVIPNPYDGPLSALVPPNFTVGPNAGHVWARISITETAVGANWDGSGIFSQGETEDYLLLVNPAEQINLDFGDAPDPGYPTLLASNGARHIIGGPWLGNSTNNPDAETNGLQSLLADGDDNNNTDDENGAIIYTMYTGMPTDIAFSVRGGGGVFEIWIDFDQNSAWDSGELIFANPLAEGTYMLNLAVPPSAVIGQTYARMRISSAGTGQPFGLAADGEVEDHLVVIEPGPNYDLGDAPDSTNTSGSAMTAYPSVPANYPTVFGASAPYGPRHLSPLSDALLGELLSLEDEADTGMDADGFNNIDPVSDTSDLDDDDDGLILPVQMPRCKWTTVDYTVNMPPAGSGLYYVNIWCDWNRDGDWNDLISGCTDIPEWAVRNQMLTGLLPGLNTVTSLPFVSWHPAIGPDQLWMRITLSEQPWMQSWGDGGCGPAGSYMIGETEDYLVTPDTSCVQCADLNCDNFVDLDDFAIFASQWLSTCP